MRTKRFFQLNPAWVLFYLLTIAMIAGCIYLLVGISRGFRPENGTPVFIMVPIVILSLFILIRYGIIDEFMYRIVLRKNDIFVPCQRRKDRKVQFKTSIEYKEIIDIQIIESMKNSLDRPIKKISRHFTLFDSIAKEYLEFTCENGSKKRIYILYFTRRQRIKIINEIKLRVKQSSSNVEFKDTIEIVDNIIKFERTKKRKK